MGGDLEPLPARLTGNVVVDANQMILDLLEHRAVARIRAAWNLRLLGAAHPADAVVVGAAASRTLEARRPLLGLFGKELSLVHVMNPTRYKLYSTQPPSGVAGSAATGAMADPTPPTLPDELPVLPLRPTG